MEVKEGSSVEASTRLIQELLFNKLAPSPHLYAWNLKMDNILVSTVRGFKYGEDFVIDYAVTRPECRNQGYSKRLIDRAKKQFPNLYVLATEDAVGFWIKQGFTRTDQDKTVLNRFEDTYLLQFVSAKTAFQ